MWSAGSYEYYGAFDLFQPKGFTMLSRRQDGAENQKIKTPGPGAYNPAKEQKQHDPSYR